MSPARRAARPWWMLCALAGLATIGFAVWFTRTVPVTSCSGPLPPGVTSLQAYQLARTPADIDAVFGRDGDSCRPGMIAALDRADTVDLFGFIPTYGLFLAAFLLAALRDGGGQVARIGLLFLAAGLGFDVIETATQLHITRGLPGTGTSLLALTIASRGKFAALAVVSLCAGLAMFARGGLLRRIAGVACIVGVALTAAGLADGLRAAMLPRGGALAWTVMFVYAVVEALRPSGPARGDVRSPLEH